MEPIYFYGYAGPRGHYWYGPGLRRVFAAPPEAPPAFWRDIEAVGGELTQEGVAQVYQARHTYALRAADSGIGVPGTVSAPWSLLAYADYSGDSRPGSFSAFLVPAWLTPASIIERVRTHLLDVLKRRTKPLLWRTPEGPLVALYYRHIGDVTAAVAELKEPVQVDALTYVGVDPIATIEAVAAGPEGSKAYVPLSNHNAKMALYDERRRRDNEEAMARRPVDLSEISDRTRWDPDKIAKAKADYEEREAARAKGYGDVGRLPPDTAVTHGIEPHGPKIPKLLRQVAIGSRGGHLGVVQPPVDAPPVDAPPTGDKKEGET